MCMMRWSRIIWDNAVGDDEGRTNDYFYDLINAVYCSV
jgi:hypothetical protein